MSTPLRADLLALAQDSRNSFSQNIPYFKLSCQSPVRHAALGSCKALDKE
ncbi:MAG TPA: hypothetical protein VNH83_25285 [Bryobacteraceae bacterium]|nr:hypothetical protein [Bryobacteraceae bacterium]